MWQHESDIMSRSFGLIVALLVLTGATPHVAGMVGQADPVPFTSNGCSGFREGKFFGCCFVHDFRFWSGGSRDDRRKADKQLRQCLMDVTNGNLYDRIVADIGYLLMVLERIPGEVIPDGWGRGWPNTPRRKYDPLTPEQESAVAAEKRRHCRQLTLDAATRRYRVNETQELNPVPARELCGEMLPITAAPTGPGPFRPDSAWNAR
jgi:hypothetical protein